MKSIAGILDRVQEMNPASKISRKRLIREQIGRDKAAYSSLIKSNNINIGVSTVINVTKSHGELKTKKMANNDPVSII